jgi:hypothetical protein
MWRRVSGADLHIKADFGGKFQYGGRFRRRIYNMEADFGGGFTYYGGGFVLTGAIVKSKNYYSLSSFFNKGRST